MAKNIMDQKLRECREMIIQNMENSLQHKMMYMFLKENKIESQVEKFSVIGKDGIIKLTFQTHDKAKKFYEDHNFISKILIRPFNIYFNVQLSDDEMKKFYLEGLTEENQRKLFEECLKFGMCKIYTKYFAGNRGKLKPTGILSFIRKNDITPDEFKTLSTNLSALGIKISNYVSDKGVKCSIKLHNFYEGDASREQSLIIPQAEAQVNKLLNPLLKDKDEITQVTITVKKKDAILSGDNPEPVKYYVSALIEFADISKTINNFQIIRSAFEDKEPIKPILFFHNEETNTYSSLFATNLKKIDPNQTDKQFEKELLECFRKVNENVIQVLVYTTKQTNSYIVRVYFRTQQSGKLFLVDYQTKRQFLYKYFIEPNLISFNINIDAKTMKKYQEAQKKSKQINTTIKQVDQAKKRENAKRPINNMPINYMPQYMMGGMGQMGGINPINPMGVMNPMAGLGMPPLMGNLGPGGNITINYPQVSISAKDLLKRTLADRDEFMKLESSRFKRRIGDVLKYCIEETGVSTPQAAALQTRILTENISNDEVFSYLEKPQELKRKLASLR